MPSKEELKAQKKLAKAEAKAAKKSLSAPGVHEGEIEGSRAGEEPNRPDSFTEKELTLHRWKVIFAGLSVLIALVSLIVLLLRS